VGRHFLFIAATIAVITSLGVAASAAPKPMVLAAIYDDSVSTDLKLPKKINSCAVKVTGLTDERRSPEMIGVYFGRAIHAPEDRDAWLRSMVASLKSRKVEVEFADAAAAITGARLVNISVTKAWIANTESNMSANIVFRFRTIDSAGLESDQFYRGGASHMSYWSGGVGELQRAFDTAVSRALDAAAADMHKFCGTTS
jgi:hypothetical protein